ncbi:MAG: ABC transporter ATP-binding protein [Treponema sp.]|nr:ABC transporter ATP-binding protein [Treponema sp.]
MNNLENNASDITSAANDTANNAEQVIIEAKNLSKSFNLEAGFFAKNEKVVYAVNDVSFSIKRGSTYGIVGESGCGKTTTARLLINMYEPTNGGVSFFANKCDKSAAQDVCSVKDENTALQKSKLFEKDVSDFSKKELKLYREKVKYIFQDPARSLNPRMNVLDILTSALRYSSKWNGKEDAFCRASKVIQEVGLKQEDLERRPQEFSGGQRQRISIARALIMEPELLICDEVVSALDVSIQGQILNLLLDLKKTHNLSFLFITHDLKVACYFCDTIGVMYRGVLVEEAPAKDLYKTAKHPYTKLLFQGVKKNEQFAQEVKTTLEQENSCVFAHRCPFVLEKCKCNVPSQKNVESEHWVRCFLWNDD